MAEEYLGDKVEKALKTIGADKVAKLIEKIGKKPCGCAGRKEALNRWHRAALDEIERIKKEFNNQ